MKRVGIVAALPGELKPLVDGWVHEGPVYVGNIAGIECIAMSGGMGVDAATKACAVARGDGALDALISYGWAGALTCGLKAPAAHVIGEVIDSMTGERFPTASKAGQRLLTLDHVARYEEKRKLAESFQAPLVDMEAVAVARVAREQGIPFYCFKAVSDDYLDKLPDFNRFMSADKQLQMSAFVAYSAFHPQYWGALIRLGKHSKAAAANLKKLLAESLSQTL